MPRIKSPGIQPPTDAPPAGLEFYCTRCGALLETVEDEQVYKPTILEGAPDLPPQRGWRIPCPFCAFNIFVREPTPIMH